MRDQNLKSGAFDGVIQIFLYNWPFYAAAFVFDITATVILLLFHAPAVYRIALYLAAAAATFWALSSLLISHYVYDLSGLYQWSWLTAVLKQGAGSWVNIHAGLDQTTTALLKIFPAEQHTSIDIYDPSQMTESSIRRARRRANAAPIRETSNASALPLGNSEWDTVFVIFAAHELRVHDARVELFAELRRALKPGGALVLVEHMRDWRNFLAYGPGFLHFFSAREWLAVCRQARLQLSGQLPMTPWVKCFVLTKPVTLGSDSATPELQNALEHA